MHATALATLTRMGGVDDHRLAHHAAGCGAQEEAVRYSVAAAAHSARLGAHREAAREYRLALRFPEVLDRQPHRGPLRPAVLRVLPHQRAAGRARRPSPSPRAPRRRTEPASEAVGAAQRWLSRLSWFLGRGDEADRYADLAVATLEPLGAGHELAWP